MRSLFPTLAALACPIGMCLIPMLLARRKGKQAGCAMGGMEEVSEGERKELHRLRTEVEALREDRDTAPAAETTDLRA